MTRPLTAPGRLVAGRYRLLSQIGGGGMGTVWLGRDERLGRQVAVKQVLPPLGTDEREADRQRERALREGRIAARLSNPHAISIYDVAVEHGQPWLVMEYLPSRSLAAVLAEDGLLHVDQAAQIGAQVADALAATHAAGIVHRDVKPANILVGRGERVEGIVKITDFGISHAHGDVTLTQTGQITGTPAFLAPEVAQGEEPLPPSDVFSLGATLYTCLEGEPPFGLGENALQLLHRVAGGEIAPPERSGVMTRPLMRMLATDPARRPTMAQVRDDLARLAAGPDGNPTTILLEGTRLRPGGGRSRTAEFPPVPPPTPAPGPTTPPPPTPTPAPPPEDPPAPEAAPGGRRRRRLLPVGAAAVVVAAAAVLLVVLLTRGGSGGTRAQGSSAAPASTASTPPSAAPTSTSAAPTSTTPRTSSSAPVRATSSAPPASSSSAPAPGAGTGDPATFLAGYHALLPGNTQAAWALTGPDLRRDESYANYQAFWRRFRSVSLGDVQVQGPTSATGELTFTAADGSTSRELHRFTLVRGPDGTLLLDRDTFVRAL
jgi:serine/threonine protein kinase